MKLLNSQEIEICKFLIELLTIVIKILLDLIGYYDCKMESFEGGDDDRD